MNNASTAIGPPPSNGQQLKRTRDLNYFTDQIFVLDSAFLKTQKLFFSHGES